MRVGWLLLALAWLAAPAAAQPSAPGRTPAQRQSAEQRRLGELWDRIDVLLGEASAARVPARVPPTPVPVRWQAKRVASIPLDAPLLALAAGDLDGDARDELVALTAREVVILAPDGDSFAVRTRAALPAEPAAVRPRTPVGTLVVHDGDGDGRDEVAARSSEQARGGVFSSRLPPRAQPKGKSSLALEERARVAGFPLCAGVLGQLEPGRHDFAGAQPVAPATSPNTAAPGTAAPAAAADSPLPPLPPRFWSVRCSRALVDPAGRGLVVSAVVASDGSFTVTSRARCAVGEQGCPAPAEIRLAGAGVAFEVADLDRDGHPELAVTRAAAPGDPDEVEISTWSGSALRSRFRRSFTGGVVGLAAGDFHGRGAPTLVGAVRLLGSHRVDLWSFNDPS